MVSKYLLLICAPVLIIKIITVQCIPEVMAPSLLTDSIGIPEGLTLGSNIPSNNIPIGPNIASLPIGPNMPGNLPMPLNNLGIGSNMGMAVGSSLTNNLGLGSNWPVTPGSGRFGFPNSISPAAMAPPMGIAAANGGGFTVTSSSPISPTGLTVNSENAIEGALIVTGQLPFLGSVSLDGAFPTAGGGTVTYGCGDGNIGIVNEGLSPNPMAQTLAPTFGQGSGIPGGQFNSFGRGLY